MSDGLVGYREGLMGVNRVKGCQASDRFPGHCIIDALVMCFSRWPRTAILNLEVKMVIIV